MVHAQHDEMGQGLVLQVIDSDRCSQHLPLYRPYILRWWEHKVWNSDCPQFENMHTHFLTLKTRRTIWYHFQRNWNMFQFLTHVELLWSTAAILEMPPKCNNMWHIRKMLLMLLLILSTKSHTFKKYRTIMFLRLAALVVDFLFLIFICKTSFMCHPVERPALLGLFSDFFSLSLYVVW